MLIHEIEIQPGELGLLTGSRRVAIRCLQSFYFFGGRNPLSFWTAKRQQGRGVLESSSGVHG